MLEENWVSHPTVESRGFWGRGNLNGDGCQMKRKAVRSLLVEISSDALVCIG